MKKLSAILIIIVFSQIIWAQNIHQKKIVTDNQITKIPYNLYPLTTFPFVNPSLGDTTGITDYDYWSNSVIGNRIAYFNGPHIVSHIRPFDGNPQRTLVYINVDAGVYQQIVPFTEGVTGFPSIDVQFTGSDIGKIGISDGISRLAIIEGELISIKQTPGNVYQSFVFSEDNIFLFTEDSQSMSNGILYKSTDGGDSFSEILNTSSFPIYSIMLNGEADIFKSPNEQFIGIAGMAVGDGHVYNGVPLSNADNVWLIYSTDAGTTWDGKSIGYDGLINSVDNRQNFAPLFENFGQVAGAVTDNGVFHVTANGYGLLFDDKAGSNILGSLFPVLYWNSQTENWKAISNPSIENIQEIVNYYPGNNIGQSYPQIATNNNGIVNVIWTAPQVNEFNQLMLLGDFYLTNINQAYSYDGGDVWYYHYSIIGDKTDVSETFAVQANYIRSDFTELYLDLIYLEDLSAGVFVFGEGNETDNPIIYKTVLVPPAPLSVNDPERMVKNFTLYQNYPNPFNPVTRISFFLPTISNVKLDIYNTLGQKVKALIDEIMTSGLHYINFEASELSSGTYFYKVIGENFYATKKMILLK